MLGSSSWFSLRQPKQSTYQKRGYFFLLSVVSWIPTACEVADKPTAATPPLLEGQWQQDSSRITFYRYNPSRGKFEQLSTSSPDRAALSVVVQNGRWTWQGSGEVESYPYTRWADSLSLDPGGGYPRFRWNITELTAHRLRVRWQITEPDTSFRKVIEYHFSR